MNQRCIFSFLKDVQQFTVKQSLPHTAKSRLIYLLSNFCSEVMPAVSTSGTFPASHCGRSVWINNGVNNPLMHAVLNVFSRWGRFNWCLSLFSQPNTDRFIFWCSLFLRPLTFHHRERFILVHIYGLCSSTVCAEGEAHCGRRAAGGNLNLWPHAGFWGSDVHCQRSQLPLCLPQRLPLLLSLPLPPLPPSLFLPLCLLQRAPPPAPSLLSGTALLLSSTSFSSPCWQQLSISLSIHVYVKGPSGKACAIQTH